MKAPKSFFICSECAYKTIKWLGRCPNCGAWNSFCEEVEETETASPSVKRPSMVSAIGESSEAVLFDEMEMPVYMRQNTGLSELDRVLGGGLVHGSVVLLSGEPGIGKSTLLLQICDAFGEKKKVLYVSGEESGSQIKLRAKRLEVKGQNLYVLNETNIERVLEQINKVKPDVVIVDSIQTMYSASVNSTVGSVTQVKETALTLINKAKNDGLSVIMVGHVNKEGTIAGPKVLEHMVDAVLYFEGERQQSYRIIRAVKNRYGSTNEIGVFEMTDKGLLEVPNPSEMLLAGRPKNISGNCAVCTIEGTRPIIAEIQALVSQTTFPSPRRTSNGIDYNRMCLIIAVLEKRLGIRFYQSDVYMNVIGGLQMDEPASDVSIAMALISSATDRVIADDVIAIGELGLAGEVRSVSNLESRVKEAARLGFKTIVVPYRNVEKRPIHIDGVEILPIRGIYQVMSLLKEQK